MFTNYDSHIGGTSAKKNGKSPGFPRNAFREDRQVPGLWLCPWPSQWWHEQRPHVRVDALPRRRRRKRSCEDSMTQTFFWHLKKLLRSFSKLSMNVARNYKKLYFAGEIDSFRAFHWKKSENQLSADRSSQLWFLCHWHLDLPIRRQVPNDTAVGSWLCRDEGDALQDRSPNGKPPKSNNLSAVFLFGGPHSPLHFQTHRWTFHGFHHYYWIIFRSPSIFQYLEHVHLFEDSSGTWKSGCFKVLFVVGRWWLILCSGDVTGMMMAELFQLGDFFGGFPTMPCLPPMTVNGLYHPFMVILRFIIVLTTLLDLFQRNIGIFQTPSFRVGCGCGKSLN